jgi:hypothetical protein
LPAKSGNSALGIAAQHVAGTGFEHDELGPVLRISGKPSEHSFAKADLRYFPTQHCLDTYATHSNGKTFADLLGSYNTVTGNTMLRPGIDYSTGRNSAVGIEAKFSGNPLRTDYVGLRTKIKF